MQLHLELGGGRAVLPWPRRRPYGTPTSSRRRRSSPTIDYVGTVSGGGSSSQGTLPRWRTYTTLDWTYRGADLTLGHTYIPAVSDIGPGGQFASSPVRVSSYQQYDLILGYDFAKCPVRWLGRLKVRVGANNVFNEEPPVAANAYPATNSDVGDYGGPIGRLFFVDATYKY